MASCFNILVSPLFRGKATIYSAICTCIESEIGSGPELMWLHVQSICANSAICVSVHDIDVRNLQYLNWLFTESNSTRMAS